MISIQDLQTAITKVLTDNGNTVTASQIKEGFKRPTFFLDLFTNNTEAQSRFSELVSVGVELKYIPAVETHEECILKCEQVKNLFLNVPLTVKDRFLSIDEIIFDIENNNLIVYFEVEFLQERNLPMKEYEKMENIEIGGVESYGSSSSNH